MPIVKCLGCRRRYDPGIEIPDDLPDEASLVVCCPACGQWMTLPEGDPADPPDVPRHVRDQMRRQATLVDEDDYDDRPRRRGGKKSPLPWVVVGLVALALLVGCGVGGYFLYSSGGDGPVTVTQASRQPAAARGQADTIEVHYTVSSSAKPGARYRVVATCQGRKSVLTREMDLTPSSRGQVRWTVNELAGTSGPVEVWFEESGRRVSNVLTFR